MTKNMCVKFKSKQVWSFTVYKECCTVTYSTSTAEGILYSSVYILSNLEARTTWLACALAGTLPKMHMEERSGEQCQGTTYERSTFLILSQHKL